MVNVKNVLDVASRQIKGERFKETLSETET